MPSPQDLAPRPVSESGSESLQLVLASDVNGLGYLQAGRLMQWIEIAAAIAAQRHARGDVVAASADAMAFQVGARLGDAIVFRCFVNRAFHTSMEVGVKVLVEDYVAGTSRHLSSAYLTFVAIDGEGRPLPVPAVVPETEEQKRRYITAGHRRDARLVSRKQQRGLPRD